MNRLDMLLDVQMHVPLKMCCHKKFLSTFVDL